MRILKAALWLAFVLAGTVPASAQSVIQRLISPGQLTAKHAQFESRCEACHSSFDKDAQPQLCKACHKDVAADIAAHRGFHGKSPGASAACRTCHIDHAGRDKNIVNFRAASFNHDFTEYPLRGKHAGLACASCHVAGHKFRDGPVQCVSCHRKNDVHKGNLGTDCASCHSETGWKDAKFDHSTTKFPLTGAHARATCASCHADQSFSGASRECVSCHKKDDAHHGSLGPNCASCHNTESWKTARFDHATTGFPLIGGHANIPCAQCHVATASSMKLPTDCVSCHRKDDVHKGNNGPECARCHTVFNWKQSTFDHDKTGFPLREKHAAILCAACHVSPAGKVKLGTTCISCHARDDKHEGQLGARCEQCHGQTAWNAAVRFDHDFATFALIGKHANVACKSCHMTPRFKDAPSGCIDCHRKDDRHNGTLGEDCASCHNPSGWANWTFDHDTQTKFPLTGAHKKIACNACHREMGKKISSECGDCHRAEDVHQGGFGPNCGRCHSTESFRKLQNQF